MAALATARLAEKEDVVYVLSESTAVRNIIHSFVNVYGDSDKVVCVVPENY